MSISLTTLNPKIKFIGLQLLVINNHNTYYSLHRVKFSKKILRFAVKGKRAFHEIRNMKSEIRSKNFKFI